MLSVRFATGSIHEQRVSVSDCPLDDILNGILQRGWIELLTVGEVL